MINEFLWLEIIDTNTPHTAWHIEEEQNSVKI